MLCRPVDSAHDILPVTRPSDLLTGIPAAAEILRDCLCLYPEEWWEYPDRGNRVLDLISVSRRTPKDAAAIASYLASYVLTCPGITSVSDVGTSFSGSCLRFTCVAHTADGPAQIEISF